MLTIGIVCDEGGYELASIIKKIFANSEKTALTLTLDSYSDVETLKNIISASNCHAAVAYLKPKMLSAVLDLEITFRLIILMSPNINGLNMQRLAQALGRKGILIINSDAKMFLPINIRAGTSIISCGINSRASVTASSITIEDAGETVQCCFQRVISTTKGNAIEPQEFPVKILNANEDISRILAAVAAAAAVDIELKSLQVIT